MDLGVQAVPIKLFSLNDYMGLSTHPRVCLAAASAAASAGMGTPPPRPTRTQTGICAPPPAICSFVHNVTDYMRP